MTKPAQCNDFIKVAITYSFIFLISLLVCESVVKKVVFDGEVKRIILSMQKEATETLLNTRSDLVALSLSPNLHDYIGKGNDDSKKNLELEFLLAANQHPDYDQIRYLDASGNEIVRVNSNNGFPVIVPAEKLQNKSDRYYFSDTMALHEGEIYVSPNDLNQEDNRIELPFKPTMRIATVIMHDGEKVGVLVINHNTTKFFEAIDQIGKAYPFTDFMILNSNSYWVASENAAEEWGFMWAKTQDITFKNRYPNAWQKILATTNGNFYNNEGYFRFSKIYPIKELQIEKNQNDEGFSYFTHDLQTNDFYGVYLIHMNYNQLWNGFYTVVLKKYVYATLGLLVIIFLLRCPENAREWYKNFKKYREEQKLHSRIKFYV